MGKCNGFPIHEHLAYLVLVYQLKPYRIELFTGQKGDGRLSSNGLRFWKNFNLESVLLNLKFGLQGI